MFCIPPGLKHPASKAARGPGCLLTGGAIGRGISLLPVEGSFDLGWVGRGQREVPPKPGPGGPKLPCLLSRLPATAPGGAWESKSHGEAQIETQLAGPAGPLRPRSTPAPPPAETKVKSGGGACKATEVPQPLTQKWRADSPPLGLYRASTLGTLHPGRVRVY